jgi:hypothetical protein
MKQEKRKIYKAEYEDENIEIFNSDSDCKALQEAWSYEKYHGTLFNLFVINDDYEEIETVL